jgi:hypothetical protein
VDYVGSLIDLKKVVSIKTTESPNPMKFEELSQDYGFLLYETVCPKSYSNAELKILELGDRASVIINGKLIGVLSRPDQVYSMNISINSGDVLDILVENMGRINYGSKINDLKGLRQVIINGDQLSDWKMYNMPMNVTSSEQLFKNLLHTQNNETNMPGFFKAQFPIVWARDSDYLPDSYIRLLNFKRGVVFINGYNLGRYWTGKGPVDCLYVPGPYLKEVPANNELIILELDGAECLSARDISDRCYVEFVDHQVFVPTNGQIFREMTGKNLTRNPVL